MSYLCKSNLMNREITSFIAAAEQKDQKLFNTLLFATLCNFNCISKLIKYYIINTSVYCLDFLRYSTQGGYLRFFSCVVENERRSQAFGTQGNVTVIK